MVRHTTAYLKGEALLGTLKLSLELGSSDLGGGALCAVRPE